MREEATKVEKEKILDQEKEMFLGLRWNNAQKGGCHKGVLCVLLFAVLVFASHPEPAFAQSSSCPGIHIDILNIKNSRGTIACALFDSPDGFPREYLRHATSMMAIEIRDTEARCDFVGIPAETYALVVIHDENRNGELDTNWLGLPTEGYGFSSDAKATLSSPSFSDASLRYDGESLDLTISLHY
ncbi:MAG: DUF2141 domain-containing protein [Desulfatiglandaceae bacterium]